jgi:hypothetical protein
MNTKTLKLDRLIFISIILLATSAHAKPLPRQMCFEAVPVRSYFNFTQTLTYDPNTARDHQYAYQTFHLTILHQVTDSNGYRMFQFIGHGSDRAGDEAAMQGTGFQKPRTKASPNPSIHLEYTANIFQSWTTDPLYAANKDSGPGPTYAIHAIWTLDQTLNGTSTNFNDITNTNVLDIPQNMPANTYNDFNRSQINRIPCNKTLSAQTP